MQRVTPQQLKEWIQGNRHFILIDVREGWEREIYNIGGIHIPLGELISRQASVPQESDVVIYCEKGIRSAIAIQRLELLGYHNLHNLEGGMKAWKEAH